MYTMMYGFYGGAMKNKGSGSSCYPYRDHMGTLIGSGGGFPPFPHRNQSIR